MKEISRWNIREWWIGGEIECCSLMANMKYRHSPLWFMISNYVEYALIRRVYCSNAVFLNPSPLPPSCRGYCSCLWSWLWWLWFLNARQFIDLGGKRFVADDMFLAFICAQTNFIQLPPPHNISITLLSHTCFNPIYEERVTLWFHMESLP